MDHSVNVFLKAKMNTVDFVPEVNSFSPLVDYI